METKIKLDYTLQTPEERKALVEQIVKQTPPAQMTDKYMEILSDYIIFAMNKEEKKKKEIITDNRLVTINKRETSYQGLVSKFENGEDGLYNITIENDKNIILTPKISISPKDVAEIPELQNLEESIEIIKEKESHATGKARFQFKKWLIELYQERYVIKSLAKQPITSSNVVKSFAHSQFVDKYSFLPNGMPHNDGLCSFFNPAHLSALLCNYSMLKEESYSKFEGDCYYMMLDLDDLIEDTLKDKYPLYYDLLIYKIDGRSNADIQFQLEQDYGIRHSVEYISSLWRNKIPKLLAENEVKRYLDWYYTFQEKGQWKRCSRCGEIKLAHNVYFSKNKTSKDGFYSICKDCRNKKNKENNKAK